MSNVGTRHDAATTSPAVPYVVDDVRMTSNSEASDPEVMHRCACAVGSLMFITPSGSVFSATLLEDVGLLAATALLAIDAAEATGRASHGLIDLLQYRLETVCEVAETLCAEAEGEPFGVGEDVLDAAENIVSHLTSIVTDANSFLREEQRLEIPATIGGVARSLSAATL
jgi:hypothetical protein